MRGSTSVGYDQFETSPEAIEQELRSAVCERRLTDRLKTNYSIDDRVGPFIDNFFDMLSACFRQVVFVLYT